MGGASAPSQREQEVVPPSVFAPAAPLVAPAVGHAVAPPVLVVDVRPPAPLARTQSKTRALVDAVQAHIPGARVVITDNRTVLLSQQTKNGVRTVRAHQMFLDAPPEVMLAVGAYLARGHNRDGAVVDAFVDAQAHLLSLAAKALPKDAHKGRVHDLMPMYLALNDRYFGGEVDAELGWSQAGSPCRRKRRSITFGSYDSRAKRIVIHPVLDQRDVPDLMVARVLHHEMVHARVGDERGPSGQRIVHGRRFAAEEARFEGAREADAWFDKHLDALLRWRPGTSLFGRRS